MRTSRQPGDNIPAAVVNSAINLPLRPGRYRAGRLERHRQGPCGRRRWGDHGEGAEAGLLTAVNHLHRPIRRVRISSDVVVNLVDADEIQASGIGCDAAVKEEC